MLPSLSLHSSLPPRTQKETYVSLLEGAMPAEILLLSWLGKQEGWGNTRGAVGSSLGPVPRVSQAIGRLELQN